MTRDIASWIRHACTFLRNHSIDEDNTETALDLQWLLSHVIDHPRSWVLAHSEYQLSVEQESKLDNLLSRLVAGEPLPYLLGHWEFFGLDFIVSPSVLIPRPETELLVEEAIKWLRFHPDHSKVIDVGTGSGCIAISIARSIKELKIFAIDRSSEALLVAKMNIVIHNVMQQINLIQGHLSTAIRSNCQINLALANLPYIPSYRLKELKVAKFEPHIALEGGKDGMDYIKFILYDAPRWLSADGLILLELDEGQEIIASEFARQTFPNAAVKVIPDMAGRPRILSLENHENDHNSL